MSLAIVLTVGFDPSLLMIRNEALRSAGYIAESALSVKSAVDRFLAGDFDLIVLCYSIPVRERDRLTCLIRASGSRTPVVSVSADTAECDAFADATIADGPNFLPSVNGVLMKAARTPGAWRILPRDKQEAAAVREKRPPLSTGDSELQHQKEQQHQTMQNVEPFPARLAHGR